MKSLKVSTSSLGKTTGSINVNPISLKQVGEQSDMNEKFYFDGKSFLIISSASNSDQLLYINLTFKYCFTINKRKLPEETPRLELSAPSGEVWKFNNPSNENKITGKAEDFCQVVTQVRNIEDVNLNVSGDIAHDWMSIAQCFAGGAETPPRPGTRKKVNRKN